MLRGIVNRTAGNAGVSPAGVACNVVSHDEICE